ncbi:MAG: hypothetical protein ACMUJK_01730 [Rhodobacterales bacterium]
MPSRSNAAPAYPALHDADATLRPESEAGRSRLNRKYTITCLAGVHIIETSIMAPAIPAFEDAFGARYDPANTSRPRRGRGPDAGR